MLRGCNNEELRDAPPALRATGKKLCAGQKLRWCNGKGCGQRTRRTIQRERRGCTLEAERRKFQRAKTAFARCADRAGGKLFRAEISLILLLHRRWS